MKRMREWITQALTEERNRQNRGTRFQSDVRQLLDKLFIEMQNDVDGLRAEGAIDVDVEPEVQRSGFFLISVLNHGEIKGDVRAVSEPAIISGKVRLEVWRVEDERPAKVLEIDYDATRGGFQRYNLLDVSEQALRTILFPHSA